MPHKDLVLNETSSPEKLEGVVQEALKLAKKAKRHNKSLSGDNFYAQKLSNLRADATNVFNDFTGQSAGDVSAMAEMIGHVFAPNTPPKLRNNTAQELLFSLRTTWRNSVNKTIPKSPDPIFPMALLVQAKRGYLTAIGRQMNECFRAGYFDACSVMMRRLLEISIIEAFEARNIASKIKDKDDNYLHLTEMVQKSLAETSWNLSRNTKKFLPQLRDLGHLSAHGRYYTAQDADISKSQQGIRIVVEEFLRLAGLL
jgi:hypothetical protein